MVAAAAEQQRCRCTVKRREEGPPKESEDTRRHQEEPERTVKSIVKKSDHHASDSSWPIELETAPPPLPFFLRARALAAARASAAFCAASAFSMYSRKLPAFESFERPLRGRRRDSRRHACGQSAAWRMTRGRSAGSMANGVAPAHPSHSSRRGPSSRWCAPSGVRIYR